MQVEVHSEFLQGSILPLNISQNYKCINKILEYYVITLHPLQRVNILPPLQIGIFSLSHYSLGKINSVIAVEDFCFHCTFLCPTFIYIAHMNKIISYMSFLSDVFYLAWISLVLAMFKQKVRLLLCLQQSRSPVCDIYSTSTTNPLSTYNINSLSLVPYTGFVRSCVINIGVHKYFEIMFLCF